jgi:hypothetical protein
MDQLVPLHPQVLLGLLIQHFQLGLLDQLLKVLLVQLGQVLLMRRL